MGAPPRVAILSKAALQMFVGILSSAIVPLSLKDLLQQFQDHHKSGLKSAGLLPKQELILQTLEVNTCTSWKPTLFR